MKTIKEDITMDIMENNHHSMQWEKLISPQRVGKTLKQDTPEYRTVFQRDFDRLIFSAPFRRMQNKTQVFPLPGSVFVHNRLTHSLEVSSVGRSLGTDVGRKLSKKYKYLASDLFSSLGDIVSAACLAHDMGNPPFGHSGEKAITSFFTDGKGKRFQKLLTPAQWQDFINFDGNANAFRLLTHRFEGRREGGFVMTYATLASIIKYPFSSSARKNNKPKFGFFQSEKKHFLDVAKTTGMICKKKENDQLIYARHPLVYLVEAADDICYQIMDLEDAHKLSILSNEETIKLLMAFFNEEQQKRIYHTFSEVTDINERIVYLRAAVINELEHACVDVFLQKEEAILRGEEEKPLIEQIPQKLSEAYKECERIACERIYRSKYVVDIELAGYHIIYTLLELLTEAVENPQKKYSELLIARVPKQYQFNSPNIYEKLLAVLDYLSGMTDIYALDLYRKITGQSLISL